MSAQWGDLNARARGLTTHLVSRATLESLAAAPDLPALGRGCVTAGVLSSAPEPSTSAALELAFRREAGRRLQRLARWLGPRTGRLTIVLEDEDRRSLRALLRGAVAGIATERRLAGLIPTPGLSERMLEALAARARLREVVALLVAWRHPYGPPLQALASVEDPDLYGLECALNRTFAERAAAGARPGDRALRSFVATTLDQENLLGALVLSGSHLERPADDAFLPGGRDLPLARFRSAATCDGPDAALRSLADCFPPPLVRLIRRHLGDPVALERALLRGRIRTLQTAARLEPLGPAPVLGYLLRLRDEALTLRTVTWGIALGAPAGVRLPREETAA